MRIAFVSVEDKTAPYSRPMAWSSNLGVENIRVKKFDELLLLREQYDAWVFFQENFTHEEHLNLLAGPKFVFLHGGSPMDISDYLPEQREIFSSALKVYDGFFLSTEAQKNHFVSSFGMSREVLHVAGFPADFANLDLLQNVGEGSHIVLCPGRYDLEKAVPLFEYALRDLLGLWNVIFTSHQPEELVEEMYPITHAYLQRMECYGFDVRYGCSGEEYYGLLAECEFLVPRTFSDSLNLSAVEALYLGKHVIAPNMPPFDEYMDQEDLYRPFCVSEIRERIMFPEKKPNREWVMSKYAPNHVVGRVKMFVEDFMLGRNT